MRCPSCSKFVSYDTDVEPEEQGDAELDGTSLTVSYRRVLACAECGDELKEATIEVAADIDFPDGIDPDNCPGSEDDQAEREPGAEVPKASHDWEIEVNVEPTTNTIAGEWNTAKKDAVKETAVRVKRDVDGVAKEISTKEIKAGDSVWRSFPPRYQSTFYGVGLSGKATCRTCGAEVEFEGVEGDEAASAFDELT
jgi:hypothetical protein